MIGEYTLSNLCQKYNINSNKIVTKNNNILTYGDYNQIDKTLDYLINEIGISQTNVEKCPSILYRNVSSIKENIEFLKGEKISFSNIETCLHVLSTEPSQLRITYKYVVDNYGLEPINRNTSILSVNKDLIIDVENLNITYFDKADNLILAASISFGATTLEEVQKIIQSKEYKDHPELFTSQTLTHAKLEEIEKIMQSEEYKEHPEMFTSTTLAHAKLDEIQKIIQSKEYRDHPEMFTSTTLAHAKLEEIQKIMQSKEYNDHPEMFTSETLAHAKLEEIQKIIQSKEYKDHPKMFTSQVLARAKLEEIQKIIQSEEYKNHPEMFTSQVLAHAKLEDISKLLGMDCWRDDRFKNLLTSSVVAKSKSMFEKMPKLIKMAEEHNIDEYLNTSFLLFSISQNYALIRYLEDNNLPLIVDGSLNKIFGKQPSVLKKKYNIDIKELIKEYPFQEKGKGVNRL